MSEIIKDVNIIDASPDVIVQNTINQEVFEKAQLTEYGSGLSVVGKPLQSTNFISGRSGWRINSNGNAEFNDGTFRGIFNVGGSTITIDNTKDIQTYLDLVYTEGGGTVFLQPGTYTLTADLNIPNGVSLQGVAVYESIIDCNTSYSVKAIGTNAYATGSVTINPGDTAVVGSGTTFTSGMVGRSIYLGGSWYTISGFTNGTNITIDTAYFGQALAGYAYAIATTADNITLARLTITNSSGAGFDATYASDISLNDIVVDSCTTGINFDYVAGAYVQVWSHDNGVNGDFNYVQSFEIRFSSFESSTSGAGIAFTNCAESTVFDAGFSGNTTNGISMTSCFNIAFLSISVNSNGAHGIEFISGNTDNQVGFGTASSNTSAGVKLTATSDSNVLNAFAVKSNGTYGVQIANANCDNNVLIGVIAASNVTASITDSGTGTLKSTTVNVLP